MYKAIETAPERIWIQISDEPEDYDEPFPEPNMEMTWCAESIAACEVPYVRADLVKAAMPDNWQGSPETLALGKVLGLVEDKQP